MERTGISRATLNNYIALGILGRPIVGLAGPSSGGARRIGYFDDNAIERIEQVQVYKKQGLSMAEIAERFAVDEDGEARAVPLAREATNDVDDTAAVAAVIRRSPGPPRVVQPGRPLRLSIDDLPHPAYMVNNYFELEWWNHQAAQEIFHRRQGLEAEIEARNVFRLLLEAHEPPSERDWLEALRLHVGVARNRVPAEALAALAPHIGTEGAELLVRLHRETPSVGMRHIVRVAAELSDELGVSVAYDLHATFFREGVLFAYVPAEDEIESLLELLARREQVVRDLLKQRLPSLTHLAVLVADLENSDALRAMLAPEDYFALVNDVWHAMEAVFRRYYGTHGKHLSDGLVYYFFPQPDCNYVMNALLCATELRETMRRISREWSGRHGGVDELVLTMGLAEGQEWFGCLHSPTNLEFSVLGDTLARARALSDLAPGGAIWATKDMIAGLSEAERARVRHGIRHAHAGGGRALVPSLYAPVSHLIDEAARNADTRSRYPDMIVTEIADVRDGASTATA